MTIKAEMEHVMANDASTWLARAARLERDRLRLILFGG
jgi:hypothetical protein